MMGSDFDRISKAISKIEQNPSKDEKARKEAEATIYYAMIDVIFHPNYRARLIWHGVKVPHFQEFSHIVEQAIFAYYKRDYAGSVLLMLCALEGILRSFSQEKTPSFSKLKEAVREAGLSQHYPKSDEQHVVYRDALSDFLENWIYRDTRSADFSLSVLNRHYVMHGLKPGNFYRPQDVHRLMLVMDLLLDFLSYSTGVFERGFLPDPGTDEAFDRRVGYYRNLSEGDQTMKQMWRTERVLLKEHPNYVEPDVEEPDQMTHAMLGIMDYMKVMGIAEKMKQ